MLILRPPLKAAARLCNRVDDSAHSPHVRWELALLDSGAQLLGERDQLQDPVPVRGIAVDRADRTIGLVMRPALARGAKD